MAPGGQGEVRARVGAWGKKGLRFVGPPRWGRLVVHAYLHIVRRTRVDVKFKVRFVRVRVRVETRTKGSGLGIQGARFRDKWIYSGLVQ